ncbi:MAG: hypothetical protein K0R05_4037 [Anaerocolumna sp.]|jgi:hypothetical protein|nr:hypothetical protein [Anaerocolumna sp.]
MSERDNKAITELKKRVDKYDRYYSNLNTDNKRPSLIVMELSHNENGYINGRYVNTRFFKI